MIKIEVSKNWNQKARKLLNVCIESHIFLLFSVPFLWATGDVTQQTNTRSKHI